MPNNDCCCSGNILEDAALLSSLTQTKAKASTAAAALEQGERLAAALDAQRDGARGYTYQRICLTPASATPIWRAAICLPMTRFSPIVHARHTIPPPHTHTVYRPLAAHAATLYFALGQLPAINPMYRFSLGAFMRLFDRALVTGDAGE